MMKKYVSPELNIVLFSAQEVLASSGIVVPSSETTSREWSGWITRPTRQSTSAPDSGNGYSGLGGF